MKIRREFSFRFPCPEFRSARTRAVAWLQTRSAPAPRALAQEQSPLPLSPGGSRRRLRPRRPAAGSRGKGHVPNGRGAISTPASPRVLLVQRQCRRTGCLSVRKRRWPRRGYGGRESPRACGREWRSPLRADGPRGHQDRFLDLRRGALRRLCFRLQSGEQTRRLAQVCRPVGGWAPRQRWPKDRAYPLRAWQRPAE